VLKAGESIYFDSSMAHAYLAQGSETCRVMCICSTPESALLDSLKEHFGDVRQVS